MSDVFDFNDSLNDVAPVSPMEFPVVKRKGKCELLMYAFYVSSFSFVITTQIECSECCV